MIVVNRTLGRRSRAHPVVVPVNRPILQRIGTECGIDDGVVPAAGICSGCIEADAEDMVEDTQNDVFHDNVLLLVRLIEPGSCLAADGRHISRPPIAFHDVFQLSVHFVVVEVAGRAGLGLPIGLGIKDDGIGAGRERYLEHAVVRLVAAVGRSESAFREQRGQIVHLGGLNRIIDDLAAVQWRSVRIFQRKGKHRGIVDAAELAVRLDVGRHLFGAGLAAGRNVQEELGNHRFVSVYLGRIESGIAFDACRQSEDGSKAQCDEKCFFHGVMDV